jgi:hypothetical protein
MYDRGAWGDWLKNAPPSDGAVTTLATHALRELSLGTRGAVDLLALSYSATDGVGHGSAYHYDRWVPFIVYGAGVPAGTHDERAATLDLAPTLAALLGITTPADLDGTARLR